MGWFLHSLETSERYPKFLLVEGPHDTVFSSGLIRQGSPSCTEQEGQGE